MVRWALGSCIALALAAALPATAATSDRDQQASVRKPPRVIIRPHRVEPGPNARRQCESWLAQEYRPSGTVIVPRMRCWWE
jgi:hypothetical protein